MKASPWCMVGACVLLGCGGTQTSARGPRDDGARDEAAQDEASRDAPGDATPGAARDLAASATFADLASAARRQDDLRDQESEAGCLIRARVDGWRLEADLAVAVRPLPPPEADLDARLERDGGPIRVLTRFGSYGGAPATLTLTAIATTLPPTRGTALALFLTDRGVYARRSDHAGGERSASRLDWQLGQIPWDDFDLVAVTAEGDVPVRALVELLERLPASLAGRVTLATPLAEGTRIPEAQTAVGEARQSELCPDGLPELAEDAPLGDLSATRIRDALDPLRRAAELCVGTSTGPGAAGGRVAIAVRIAADGRVSDACVMEDATADPALRSCLVSAARELAFDPPGGFLDFALPLALAPGSAQRQSPVCR